MIKTNSPYYVSTPFVSPASGLTCVSYTLSIWVWDGAKASPPVEANYTTTKNNPTASTGSDEINIARLISDFIEFEPQETTTTNTLDSNNNLWVKTSVTYITTTAENTPQLETTNLISLGYSYGNEGKNITTITNDVLIPTQDYKANRDGVFVVPILIDEAVGKVATVKSYPDNEIDETFNYVATTDSSELVQYIWIQCNETTTDEYIEVEYNSQTVTLLLEDECKYQPVDVFFINKEGAEQVFTFFKEQKNNIEVNSTEFESDRGQPSEGNHQFIRYNVQAREGLTLNSGFVDEEMNEIFTQMLLSERIWSYDGSFTPLNIESKSLSYKTQLNERLINYEIRFKPSYNTINNI
mgnify:CR=1 FL=1